MKLLYIHNGVMDVAGANKSQVMSMCEAFKKNGVKTTLLAIGKSRKKVYSTYKVKNKFDISLINTINNYYARSIVLFTQVFKKRKKVEYIFARDMISSFLIKTFLKNKKVIYELHDFTNSSLWHWMFRKTFNKLDHVIVISEPLKEDMVKDGYDADKISVMHDGVNLDKFNVSLTKAQARKKLGLPNDKQIVLYMGSTDETRDLGTLVKVAKKLPNVNFVIYGRPKPYLEKNKPSNVFLKGFTNQPEAALKAADVLFGSYTTKVKTVKYMSPLKLFEYMGSKRPMVAADLPAVRDILDRKEALFYKPENEKDLLNQIKKFLKDEKLQKTVAKNAFNKVKQNDWTDRTKKILKIYKSL